MKEEKLKNNMSESERKRERGSGGLVGSNEASSCPTTADAAEFCQRKQICSVPYFFGFLGQLEKLNILGST